MLGLTDYEKYCGSIQALKSAMKEINDKPELCKALKELIQNLEAYSELDFHAISKEVQTALEASITNCVSIINNSESMAVDMRGNTSSSLQQLTQNSKTLEKSTEPKVHSTGLMMLGFAAMCTVVIPAAMLAAHYVPKLYSYATKKNKVGVDAESVSLNTIPSNPLPADMAPTRKALIQIKEALNKRRKEVGMTSTLQANSPQLEISGSGTLHPNDNASVTNSLSTMGTVSMNQETGFPNTAELFHGRLMARLNKTDIINSWEVKTTNHPEKNETYIIQSSKINGTHHRALDVTVSKENVSAVLTEGADLKHLAEMMVHAAVVAGQVLDDICIHGGNEAMKTYLRAEIELQKNLKLLSDNIERDELHSSDVVPRV